MQDKRNDGWYIRIICEAYSANGKRHRFNRAAPSFFRTTDGLKKWIADNLPPAFHGCELHILTPIHHNVAMIEPDTREFHYLPGPNG